QLPATGRSNQIATIFGAQDISQIEDMYGRSKKDALLANLNNQFYGRVGHRETAQYIADLWGREYVQQRTEGQNESSRNFETTQGRSVSHSYTERSRVRIQDVLELQTGEFYGQLVDSDFSSFKAQIKAQEPGSVPEIVPVTTATSQAVKNNFIRIQEEIENVLASQRPGQGRAVEPLTPQPSTPAPANGQAQYNGQSRHPGESLDF
ncbi:TraM recognition domain-containing protein, partial [Spirosoma soli]